MELLLPATVGTPQLRERAREARMIPIDFTHCPTAKRPGKNADATAQNACKEAARQANINRVALERMQALRGELNARRPLRLGGDNRFVNRTVLSQLPPNTTFIGRMRKDAALFHPPAQQPEPGATRLDCPPPVAEGA